MVPVETIAGLRVVSWMDCGGGDAMAWSSGLLDIIAEARLISEGGFEGADVGAGAGL